MKTTTCEICGDVVDRTTTAACGHEVVLCRACRREYPGALEACAPCEEVAGAEDD